MLSLNFRLAKICQITFCRRLRTPIKTILYATIGQSIVLKIALVAAIVFQKTNLVPTKVRVECRRVILSSEWALSYLDFGGAP
jgi:hypothetical protein